jgi:hypothetical protein
MEVKLGSGKEQEKDSYCRHEVPYIAAESDFETRHEMSCEL